MRRSGVAPHPRSFAPENTNRQGESGDNQRGDRMTDNARKVAGALAMMDAINPGEDVKMRVLM